jgi:hypothetical protein
MDDAGDDEDSCVDEDSDDDIVDFDWNQTTITCYPRKTKALVMMMAMTMTMTYRTNSCIPWFRHTVLIHVYPGSDIPY